MQNMNDYISFTARNPQIRDAQWVCQTVNSNFGHISTTKIRPKIEHLINLNPDLFDKYLQNCNIRKLNRNKFNKKDKNLFKIFNWHNNLIHKLKQTRQTWQSDSKNNYRKLDCVFMQLKLDKLGNCGEDALVSEAILKMNGKNAFCAQLKVDGIDFDHSVCVLNPKDKNHNDKIHKKSIIIDSWLGIADYAENIFLKYKNLYKDYFYFKSNSDIQLCSFSSCNLTPRNIEQLKSEYPELVYKGKNFMKGYS